MSCGRSRASSRQSAPLVNLAGNLRRLTEGVTYEVETAMRKGA